jgi:hypothetical protein
MAFKYKATYKWNSKPKYIWSNIEDFFYWIKHFIQRGWRGWADCDTWGMDGYLIEVMIPMLKHLKETKHGYPGDLTPGRWDKIMDKMIKGLEAGDRFLEDDYLGQIQPDWAKDLGDNWLEELNKHPIKKESWKKYHQMARKDEKEFHRAIELINHYFFALWD